MTTKQFFVSYVYDRKSIGLFDVKTQMFGNMIVDYNLETQDGIVQCTEYLTDYFDANNVVILFFNKLK